MPRPRNKRPVSVEIFYSEYDGKWHGYKTVGRRPNGRPDVRHRSAPTREECEEKIRQLEDEMAAGTLGRAGRKPTVQEWFTTWLTDIAPHQPSGSKREPLRASTLQGYWSKCRTWIFPHLGGIRLDALDPDDLDRLYTAMYEAGKGSETVRQVHSIIRRGLAMALQRGKVARNIAAQRDSPGAASNKRGVALSEEQVHRVLAAIERRRNRARWKVGLAIGPRQGEALALRWSYVDWDEGVVDTSWQIQRRKWRHGCDDPQACGARPRPGRPQGLHRQPRPPCTGSGPVHDRYHTRGCPKPVEPCPPDCTDHASTCLKRRGGGLVFCRSKTYRDDEDTHLVALPKQVMDDLREHRRRQAEERLAAGTLWEDNDLVFCQLTGRPVDPHKDWEEWREILAEAGLEAGGTHVMRRTAATMLLELGEDLAVVQEVLGHSDIRLTRRYTKVSVGLTKVAAKRMEGLFSANATDLATERRNRRIADGEKSQPARRKRRSHG